MIGETIQLSSYTTFEAETADISITLNVPYEYLSLTNDLLMQFFHHFREGVSALQPKSETVADSTASSANLPGVP